MNNILEIAAKFQTQPFYLSSERIWLFFFDFFFPVYIFIQF